MALTTTDRRIIYYGTGSGTTFAFPYKFEENADIICTLFNTITFVTNTLALGVDFTVVGAGLDAGGTITTTSVVPVGTDLVIERTLPLTQQSSYDPNASIPTDQLDNDLDRLVMIAQQLQDSNNNGLTAPSSDPTNQVLVLPPAAARANQLLGFDSNGLPIVGAAIGVWAGDWIVNTNYNQRDLVRDSATGNVYYVVNTYTSSSTIAADISAGNLALIFEVSLPGSISYGTFGTDTGTANTYVSSSNPAPSALVSGLKAEFVIGNSNTGASTFNFNGLGVKNIKKNNAIALTGGEMTAGWLAVLEYDGTQWRLLSVTSPAKGLTILTSSGNFTVPTGVTQIKVTVVGGGGSGGSSSNTSNSASGGGAGGRSISLQTVTPGQVLAGVIGAGGASVPFGNAGATGGSVTFNGLVGLGGAGGNQGGTFVIGGIGGTASGGSLNIPGEPGKSFLGTSSLLGAAGGASGPYGSGGLDNGSIADGNSATGYGAGGGGSYGGSNLSGAGSSGVIIIEY